MSNNLEILLIWNSRDQKFCFLPEKASLVKKADVRDMFKKISKGVCTSTVVVSLDPLSPIPPTSSTMKTPKKPEDPASAAGDTQMEYSFD
jgi:hypothetical protein